MVRKEGIKAERQAEMDGCCGDCNISFREKSPRACFSTIN